ncbi:ParB/RepB/Spo0J family partition protein [Kocuria aegyptia]|uniref:ParB/RepB/Spo0J family partition protein n=1 Tax=Kocuria aegyptia TaxID=330943 RepID=UPI003CD07D01
MKARMDMGEALRNTTLVSRPSDMFFVPSAGAPEDGRSSTVTDRAPSPVGEVPVPGSTAPGQQGVVPRETSDADTAGTAAVAASAEERLDGTAESADSPAPFGAETTAEKQGDVPRETDTGAAELAAVPGATFAEIPVASIHPNRKQPRQIFDEEELAELAFSIGELGVLQPIVVRPTREDGEQSYELVMGERRWRATQRAGLPTIPAIVRETADDDLLRDALLENLHRSQLNPLEEAAAYQQLLDEFGTTQEELSRRIGRSRPQISNTIRLLRLPPLVQRRVAAGVLSSGHARALLSLPDPAEMERLAQRIVAEGLSVRATEEAVQLTETGKRKPSRAAAPAGRHKERLDYIAEAFSDRLDTSVRIALGARKGKMTIEFASVEDLNRIIEVLDPGMDRT